ncbi:MAG: gamma-type small acid-soluble spore protein [Bacillaceae bacterium]|nr:gamma-type small acid-soluble spore protein [Bacillaceae bacterium]
MAKETQTGTNVEHVRKRNAASQAGDSEFAAETNAADVRRKNQASQAKSAQQNQQP